MAPLQTVKKFGPDKRVQIIIEAAEKVSSLLQSRNQLPSGLEVELEGLVKRSFPISASAASADNLSTFDSQGCHIWNATSNILRGEEGQRDPSFHASVSTRTVVLLRTFAFFLVNTTNSASSKYTEDQEQYTRNFRTGLKACRFCLERGALDLSLIVLERCAEHVRATEEASPLVRMTDCNDESDRIAARQGLVSEYYLLRMTQAWKSDRLDLAEHFFSKIPVAKFANSICLSERAATVFYDIGRSLVKKELIDSAVKWLERALIALSVDDIECSSQDFAELRLAIVTSLVDSLISSEIPELLVRSRDLVENLDLQHGLGNRMAVHLMRLKVLLASRPVKEQTLREAMSKVLRSAVLNEHTFKIIMQSIHKVRKVSSETACHALAELITKRLLPDLSTAMEVESHLHEWLEKSCVTYALFATSGIEESHISVIEGLEQVFNSIVHRLNNKFSPKATHAAQALVWKAAGNTDCDVAERWCNLLRHPLFDSAGHVNKAKIGRKAMTVALTKDDFVTAREAFFQMPAAAQNEDITRYLAFKLALRMNDYALAKESLNAVASHADRDATYLYACVLEAQQSKMRHIAVAALQAMLDNQPASIHLPSLLRCTARLLVGELETQERSLEEVMEDILRTFEHAAANRQVLQRSASDQWRAEIQWWTKNAYNLALRLCGQIHTEQLLRLLNVCTTFIDCYPDDAGPMYWDEIKCRQALCHFLSACALVPLGRSSAEGSEDSLQYYLQARQEIAAVKSLQQHFKQPDKEEASKRRLFEVLKFDLECIYQLEQWDQLETALQACLDLEGPNRWDALADIVLIIHRQTISVGLTGPTNARMMELLERIVNQTWLGDKSIVKAARWLRLSFLVDLNDGSGEFALKLMAQAATMAKKGSEGKSGRFPETELQWLSTTSFNKAVDLLSAGHTDGVKRWIDAAVELARYADDEGALHANLTFKKEQATARMIANAL